MSGELSADGYKLDGPSQRMLRALRGGNWQYSATLRDAAELDDNRQVSYRMEHYLGPAGMVVEAVRDEPEKEARRFRLTDEGAAWVVIIQITSEDEERGISRSRRRRNSLDW